MKRTISSSDVWLLADLVNILAALTGTADTMTANLPASPEVQAYRAGYRAAVAAMLVAIGAQPAPRARRRDVGDCGDVGDDYDDTALPGGGTLAGGYDRRRGAW